MIIHISAHGRCLTFTKTFDYVYEFNDVYTERRQWKNSLKVSKIASLIIIKNTLFLFKTQKIK